MSTSQQQKLRVLIADDNVINLKVIRIILTRLGHEVEAAENGLQAVEICRQQRFDAILMDIQMPVMDGLEATRAILREHESSRGPAPVIIALTAGVLEDDHDRCIGAGMSEFLQKPIKPQIILECLERFFPPSVTVADAG